MPKDKTGENAESMRRISLGIERPEVLDERTIYVDIGFSQSTGQPCAVAYSNQRFTYHSAALAGNLLTHRDRYRTTLTGTCTSRWQMNIREFVGDLVDSNKGQIDYERLVEDSSSLVARFQEAKIGISKADKALQIRTPHTPKLNSNEKP